MKKYDEYKDSGVAWIGEVPKHWEVIPFKRAMTINNGSDYKHIQVDVSGYPVIGSGGEFARASQYVYDGEVVLLGRKGTIDKPMYYNGKFWTVDTMFYAIPKKYINCKYLYYQALNIPFERYATATALPSMTQTDLNMNVICLPPTIEQTAIAAYLDTHCAKIDNLISIQQKRIALLQELKQSVITHAVTKGLNPNVEMKQSGVEWIGDVPKHWKVLRGKYALSILSGFPFDSQKFEFEDNGVYMPLIRIRDINGSSTEVYYSGSYPIESVVKTGEVLIGMDGDFNISKWKGTNALLNQRVCKLREDSSMNTHYAFYMLSSPLKAINSVTYATTVKHLSVYDIYNAFIPVPPISEQAAIASYLDHKCATIDTSISNAQHQIDLLQEYKQSLITEVVTGKRKVTDN